MINQKKAQRRKLGNKGFTLIEILIVVMVLGILAMVIVPQITVSTQDAKESTLQTNIVALRNAIELYYHQHNNVYPGFNAVTGAASTTDALSATAFVAQLVKFTGPTGIPYETKALALAAGAAYGPYIKSDLPTNPFNSLNTVGCDFDEASLAVKASSGTAGWKFYPVTGILVANDGAHDTL